MAPRKQSSRSPVLTIAELKTKYNIPDSVTLRRAASNLNLENPIGLANDEMIIYKSFLKIFRFPLHPIVRVFLHIMTLAPTQLNLNSYRIILGTQAINLKFKTLDVGIDDILHRYQISRTRDTDHLYHLHAHTGRALFSNFPSSESWKDEVLIVGGQWSAPGFEQWVVPKRYGEPCSSSSYSSFLSMCVLLIYLIIFYLSAF